LGDPEFAKVADLFRNADTGFANQEGAISRQSHAHATFKTQSRFLSRIEQCGRVVKAARWPGVPRALHYLWPDEDRS
jgi:hypothetical protein